MTKALTTKDFIRRSKEIHGDKYDYSKTDLNQRDDKGRVVITCPIHGEFWQKPSHHLSGHICKRCVSSKTRKKRGVGYNSMGCESFIEKAKLIHSDKYDYSKVDYVNYDTEICIICPKHGEFWQTPDNHLHGKGCKKCGLDNSHKKQMKTTDKFISECKDVFGDLYDYTETVYNGKNVNVIVKCNKCGRKFEITPHNHLIHKEGCSYCKQSKMEKSIGKFLDDNGIEYETQKTFKWLINGKSIKKLDFYLPKHNIAIECQGLQHFKPIEWFGGEKNHNIQKNNDELKRKLCKENNIKLLYYSDLKIDFPYKVITNKYELIENINKS